MATEQIRVDLTAKDDASKTIDKVADKAEDLEKLSPEVEVSADTDKAARGIDDVADAARALSRVDAEIVLRAKIDPARGELKALQAELEQTGDKAVATAKQLDRVDGPEGGGRLSTRGNAIADLTGPLGEASSAASDFAGVFDGLGDIAEDVAAKLGASQRISGMVSQAVGGLGIVAAGAAAAWGLYSQAQENARRKAEETRKALQAINDALTEGDLRKAAAGIREMWGGAADAARKAGLTTKQFTDYVTGAGDELGEVGRQIDAARDKLAAIPDEVPVALRAGYLDQTTNDWLMLGASLDQARTGMSDVQQASEFEKQAIDEMSDALGYSWGQTKKQTSANEGLATSADKVSDALERIRDGLDVKRAAEDFTTAIDAAMWAARDDSAETVPDIRGVEDAILHAGEVGRLNPIQVDSLIKAVEEGNLEGVKFMAEDWFRKNPVGIVSRVLRPTTTGVGSAGGGGMPISAFQTSAPTEVVNVYQTVPRGYHGDVLADARKAQRRAGGLYQRNRR
jgi:hypothetical protein